MINATDLPVRVLADGPAARETTRLVNDWLIQPPPVIRSSLLTRDLAELATAEPSGRVFVPFGTVYRHLSDAQEDVERRLALLAGHEHPPYLAGTLLLEGLRSCLLRLSRQSSISVIVHDRTGLVIDRPTQNVALINELPPLVEPEVETSGDHEDEDEDLIEDVSADAVAALKQRLTMRGSTDLVPRDALLEHARFIVDSTPSELRTMHRIPKVTSFLPVYLFWIEQFQKAGAEGEDHDLLEAAANRLGEAAGA